MTPRQQLLRSLTADWKPAMILALPIFGAALAYGIVHHFDDMALYAVAIAIGSWGIAGWAVFVVRKWQEWRMQSRDKA